MTQSSKRTDRLILLLFVLVVLLLILFVTRVFHLPLPGKAPVKYGFINRQGQAVIPFEYDSIGDFSRGLATVAKDGHVFVIDTQGRKTDAKPFYFKKDTLEVSHIVITHTKGEYDRLNTPYVQIGPPCFEKILFRIRRMHRQNLQSPEVGYFDFVYLFRDQIKSSDNRIMYEEAFPYCDGLALVRNEIGKQGLREWQKHNWGFIGLDGTYAIRPLYIDAHSFSEGLAGVGILNRHHSND
jgi:hypothetical protein